jgi:hypothetical protein
MITIALDPDLYPPVCVRAAIAAFSYLSAITVEEDRATVSVQISSDDAQLVDEFLNYVLARSMELKLTPHADTSTEV